MKNYLFIFILILSCLAERVNAEDSNITINRQYNPVFNQPEKMALGPYANNPTTPFLFALWQPVQLPNDEYNVMGFKLSMIYGSCCNFDGFDLGLVSVNKGNAIGLVMDMVSYVKETMTGLQMGIYNGARHVDGVQIGLINYTESMEGVQLGLINIIESNDLPFMPFINLFL